MGCAVGLNQSQQERSPEQGILYPPGNKEPGPCHADEPKFERTRHCMKNSVKSLLVAAAVTGLLGVTAVPFAAADDKATTDKAATAQTTEQKDAAKADKDKHSC